MNLNEINSTHLDKIKDTFNNNLESVPGFVKSVFGNEVININITSGEETIGFNAKTEKGMIVQLKKGNIDDRTMDVFSDVETMNSLLNSGDLKNDIKMAFDSGKITYKAHKVKTKLKLWVAKTSFKVFSWFS